MALSLHFAVLEAHKTGRTTLLSGITGKAAAGINTVRKRLLHNEYVTFSAATALYVYCNSPLGCEITFPGSSILPSRTVQGFLALPCACTVKFTNITPSTSADGGIDITLIGD